jgi:hypothetical protein
LKDCRNGFADFFKAAIEEQFGGVGRNCAVISSLPEPLRLELHGHGNLATLVRMALVSKRFAMPHEGHRLRASRFSTPPTRRISELRMQRWEQRPRGKLPRPKIRG